MIRCQLAAILGQRRADGQEPYTFAAVARETGLHFDTVANLANNKTQRYDAPVLDALCLALGVDVGDLLVHVPNGNEPR